jgi:hypothetical protein
MATKKKEAPKKEATKAPAKKSKETSDDKAAKKAARMEKLKNRPDGQRPNSKQVDVIQTGGCTIENFGYSIRKQGTLVTSVLKNAKGEPISVSTTFVPGTKAKSKKGHGTIVPGLAGVGKKGKAGDDDDDDDEDGDED